MHVILATYLQNVTPSFGPQTLPLPPRLCPGDDRLKVSQCW